MKKTKSRVFGVVGALFVPFLVSSGAVLPQHPPGEIDLSFPMPAYYQEYAASGGNPRPENGRLLIFLGPDFDPQRIWPTLIGNSTTDAYRTSVMDAPW